MPSLGQIFKLIHIDEFTFSPYTSGYGRLFIIRSPRFMDCSSPWYECYRRIPPTQWYQLYRSQERSKILHDGFNEKVSELLRPKTPSVIDGLELYREFDPFIT